MKYRMTACLALAAALTAGCSTMYYKTMETVGVEKRDILTSRVAGAKDELSAASGQFKSALEVFMEVVDVDGGELEKTYDRLQKEFDRSEARAQAVHDRIADIERVADDLFKEWKKELKQYTDRSMREASEKKLAQTRDAYEDLIAGMKKTAATMDPVLNQFRDQVLFLKHNLNSQAIAGLQDEASRLQMDVSNLIRQMEDSIAEADAFLQGM